MKHEMTESQLRELDIWIWKTLFKGRIISKRFSQKRTGFKLRDESGEYPNFGGLHGWGWLSSRESALNEIPHFTTNQHDAMMVLEKCLSKVATHSIEIYEGAIGGPVYKKMFGIGVMNKNTDGFAPTLPLAIALCAKKLFTK